MKSDVSDKIDKLIINSPYEKTKEHWSYNKSKNIIIGGIKD